jgi:hypothetical protein
MTKRMLVVPLLVLLSFLLGAVQLARADRLCCCWIGHTTYYCSGCPNTSCDGLRADTTTTKHLSWQTRLALDLSLERVPQRSVVEELFNDKTALASDQSCDKPDATTQKKPLKP